MNLSTLTRSLSAIVLAGSFCFAQTQTKKTWTDAEVMKIHKDAYLVDLHNDRLDRLAELTKGYKSKGSSGD